MEIRLDTRVRELPSRGIHDVLAHLAAIEEFKGWWQARSVADAPALERLAGRVVRQSAAASLQVGDRLAPPAWHPDRATARQAARAAHVHGYAETLRALITGHRGMTFGEDLIRRLHADVLRYSDADAEHRGRYVTTTDVRPSFMHRASDPPALRATDPDLVPRAMATATRWADARLAGAEFHPLLVIGAFGLELMAIRPFVSGNGRVARLVGTYLLLRSGYAFVPYASAERIIAERWTDYYFALRQSQASTVLPRPDLTPWLSMFLVVIRTQARQLRERFDQQPDATRLSSTQLGVLRLLDRHGEVTNRLVCGELRVPRETAKQVLNRLLALNFVRRIGSGRAVRYRKALRPASVGGGLQASRDREG